MKTIGYSIPVDLMIEILLKTPAKTVARFKSVSKSWCSIINSQQFINAFMSLSRPRLVIVFNVYKVGQLLFFSSPHQICSFSSSSSISVAKKYTLTMPQVHYHPIHIINSVRGFVCCSLWDRYVVCNPTTGQVINLGNRECDRMYLGYDPNSDKYKVLRFKDPKSPDVCYEHSVRTLGSSDSWRSIKSSILYCRGSINCVCIDGVVYYKCIINVPSSSWTLGSFNVGSEVLGLIQRPTDFLGDLTNYLGKLAIYNPIANGFNLWVLDDVKNQIWSKKTYVFPISGWSFRGITASGELIYVPRRFFGSFKLVCYDVEKKVKRRVRVEGLSDVTRGDRRFYCSLLCSYVDNIIYL